MNASQPCRAKQHLAAWPPSSPPGRNKTGRPHQMIPWRLPPMPEAKVPRRGHRHRTRPPASNTREDLPAAQTLLFRLVALAGRQQQTLHVLAKLPWARARRVREAGRGNTGRMVDDAARDRAIYHALKAADEVAAALQAHLIEEHSADLDRAAAQSPAADSLTLLRQARERLGEGLRAVEAGRIANDDQISLRNP
jgi:hypothetical protein